MGRFFLCNSIYSINEKKERVKVVLDLKQILLEKAIQTLQDFKNNYPAWKENVSCPLDELNRELNGVVRNYYNELQAKGMKAKAANACGISRKTQERYEKYTPK